MVYRPTAVNRHNLMSNYEHQFIQTNNITLHVVLAGPIDGPPVILLHGFPEFWFGWHKQIHHLAQQGYRVIVPDQRGYNLSDKPQQLSAYHIDELAKDITGLMDALGYKSCYLVGHDWGGAVAWWLASHYPERLRKLAILNIPHPAILMDALRSGNKEQLRKSWYIFAFQLPVLAEWGFKRLSQANGRNLLAASSRPDSFTPAELIVYEHAWRKPGAITGMLNWYRQNFRQGNRLQQAPPPAGSIEVPTLMLWGEKDVALGKELAEPSIALCADGRLIFFPNATHWLQHDEPESVNQYLSEFFN